MVLMETPVCNFGEKAVDFKLHGVDDKDWTLADCLGEKGLLVMFICNHCPYVKSIQNRLVEDTLRLKEIGINSVAIMSNDPTDYPEDSFENMQKVASEFNYPFPYLFDKTQEIAKAYGAICTPDFFGYNTQLELQYRGRLDASGMKHTDEKLTRDLLIAMTEVANTGHGPKEQIPSMGCSIKWKSNS
jgi:peroxiredoxin